MNKPTFNIINGNSATVLKTFPDNHFDAVITDPPYGINFLGKEWDKDTGEEEVYRQCLRVLKPGGHLLAFSAARTYHHLAMAVEKAGFEIRDQIMWVYGSGFPKSSDIGRKLNKRDGKKLDNTRYADSEMELQDSGKYLHKTNGKLYTKYPDINGDGMANVLEGGSYGSIYCEVDTNDNQWSGWGTNLKPAHEPIVMARKPVEKSIIDNVQKYGVGALNVDACRVEGLSEKELNWTPQRQHTTPNIGVGGAQAGHEQEMFNPKGRFPANFIHDGSDEVVAMFPHSKSGARKPEHKIKGLDTGEKREVFGSDAPSGKYTVQPFDYAPAEEGSAARFFYVPKVGRKERHTGCDMDNAPRPGSNGHGGGVYENDTWADSLNNVNVASSTSNTHPTVKPVELMKYLIKLVTPPNSHILDPFNGSGSTGMAAVELGHQYTGIELDPNYVQIAEKRIQAWWELHNPPAFDNPLFTEETK